MDGFFFFFNYESYTFLIYGKYSWYQQNDVFIYGIHPSIQNMVMYMRPIWFIYIYKNYVVDNYPNNNMYNLATKFIAFLFGK